MVDGDVKMFPAEKRVLFAIIASLPLLYAITLPYTDTSRCSQTEYFQYSSLRCKSCPANTNRSSDGLSCVCKNGYYFVQNGGSGDYKVLCNKCGANEVTARDQWSCVKCPDDRMFDPITATCIQCNTSTTAYFDKQRSGVSFPNNRRQCTQCLNDTQPDLNRASCKRCHQEVLTLTSNTPAGTSCDCPPSVGTKTGGICISTKDLTAYNIPNVDSTFTVKYGASSILSSFFKENLIAAKYLCCQNRNFTACQLLANLCVMLDYNEDNFKNTGSLNTDACEEYLKIQTQRECITTAITTVHGVSNWPEFMPWLYYSGTSDLEKTDISTNYKKGEKLRFVVIAFTPNGTFVGIQNDTNVIQLCQESASKMASAFSFLTTYKSSCTISVQKLKSQQMLFYDLYYFVGDKLYPVPILVENYLSGGTAVNTKTDKTKWKLTRRFFLVDTLGGKTQSDQPATVIRYAEKIQLVFTLRNSNGQIYPPYMRIKYGAVSSTASSVSASFSTLYEMNTAKVNENVQIAVGVLSAFGIIFALIRTSSWRRRNDKLYLDCSSLLQLVIFTFSALSVVFFAVLAGTCFQWLIFFKQQTVVYRILPTTSQESLLRALLICAFIFKLIDILYILFSQIFVDIFFIDWERPRGRIIAPGQTANESNTPVSIIRTLFVANEWREIQTLKRIKPTLQLILVLFFLKVAGFEHLTTTDPVSRFSVNQATDYVGEVSFVLRFAVTAILFICIAVGQWLFFGLIYERFVSDAIEDFVDFCSISNVSIFLLTHDNYGYYIHGRSVHGRADTSLRELYENFKREEDSLCDKRGLEPDTECQTFEILLPAKFRNQYEKITDVLGVNQQQKQRQMARNGLPPTGRGAQGGTELKLSPTLERSVVAYNTLNRFLTSFIEHSSTEQAYVVKDKLMLERILDIELQAPLDKGIFFNDESKSFTTALLYGVEWSLLLFDLLLFAVIDMAATNYILAAVVTYFGDILIVAVRDTMGKKNLARKTLVHERFLI